MASYPESIDDKVVFIIGSQRSGTTVFQQILSRHPKVTSWDMPYFVWERHTGVRASDVLRAEDADQRTKSYVRREFDRFLQKSGKEVLIEKTSENAFRVDFINEVFPRARFIHMIRDGRDAVVSMDREWLRRAATVEGLNPILLLSAVRSMMSRQPNLRNRVQAVRYELGQRLSLNPRRYFNKAKWKGRAAWGARFEGWEPALDSVESTIEFHGMQWRHSVEAALDSLSRIDPSRHIELRYEQLVKAGDDELARIFDFVGVELIADLASDLETKSVGQWSARLDKRQRELVARHAQPLLMQLGYVDNASWVTSA